MRIRNNTLAFSVISYLLIATFAFLYIHSKVTFGVLFSLTSASPQPLSSSEFNIVSVILIFGVGACICLMFSLGMAVNGQGLNNASVFFGFVSRTMQIHDRKKAKFGDLIFSDYTRKPNTIVDALQLQTTTLVRALRKILGVYLSVGFLGPVKKVILGILFFLPNIVLAHKVPTWWNVTVFSFWFFSCYRGMLLWLAKTKGVARTSDVTETYRIAVSPSLNSSIQFALSNRVTPELIAEVLCQESVIHAIKNDLMKTGQIGYKEVWRLGLITSDQDRYDPRPSQLSRQERMKGSIEDNNYRSNLLEQIPLRRAAALYNPGSFNVQFDRLTVRGGLVKPRIGFYPGWSYGLSTKPHRGEFTRIRDIQLNTDSPFAQNRSKFLPRFLQEEGFPLKESYSDGDPLTSDRGGTIVIDKEKLIIIYPRYFVQRRLIDDRGELVDIGRDESFSQKALYGVKMRPSVSELLVRHVKANGYLPVLRYRSVPYASEFMFPILDTPTSDSGWADLFIDTRGKGKLFIAREKTLAEWYEMMTELRQLLYEALAQKDYHLFGLTRDKVLLNEYMDNKRKILLKYYIIQDWALP
jgi:hypothetical protein